MSDFPCGCKPADIDWGSDLKFLHTNRYARPGLCPCGQTYHETFTRLGYTDDEEKVLLEDAHTLQFGI